MHITRKNGGGGAVIKKKTMFNKVFLNMNIWASFIIYFEFLYCIDVYLIENLMYCIFIPIRVKSIVLVVSIKFCDQSGLAILKSQSTGTLSCNHYHPLAAGL